MSLRILSVLLALLLWLYVNNEQNPVHSQLLTVTLQQRGLPQNMSVSGSIPQSVSIRVQGTRSQLATLTAADFEAVLDLTGLGEGEHSVQVRVGSPPGLQVQANPNRVAIALESIVEQQVPVTVALNGSPLKGFYVLAPVAAPQVATVKGPRSRVGAITQLGVAVDVEGVNSNIEKTLPLPAQSGVSISPASVRVTVPVTQLPAKTVPVRTGVTGTPMPGYEVIAIMASPAEVQVTAPPEVLAGIKWLEAEKVNINGAAGDVQVSTAVTPPANAVEVKPSVVETTVRLQKIEVPPPAEGDAGAAQGGQDQ
jgi:YbbR domain-containing protein